jgi:putative ABC transport system permease protein
MTLAMAGVGIGMVAALGLTPLITSFLYGLSPLDPLTLTIAPLVLAIVAFVACYIPARRAAHADPKVALRYE